MDSVGALLPFVLILLAFYLLIIRPARKRASAATHLQDSLAVGQKIMTTSGMYAEIVAVEDIAVVLETSPGITGRWAKAAVARVLDETLDDGSDTDASTTFDTDSDTADPDESGKRSE